MNPIRCSIPWLIVMVVVAGCGKEDKVTINKAVWSSKDPLNIPYKRRMSELNEGNKVLNPSFERGRFFNDRLNTFELVGWTEIGNSTEWVSTEKGAFDRDEVDHGRHSIRIRREKTDELQEEGAGMLSDYIKVIAGNYRLDYSIRLHGIDPYRDRWGSRLQDAVNVRVYYYNKNKIRIDGVAVDPMSEKKFDNEFKALPFAGHWSIDSLGWIRARGISHKFPFPDGDIPDETRYVRLFFGLKGPGTMWVDNVRFRFTHGNFSLYERVQRWKDSTFTPYDLITPAPRHLEPGKMHRINDRRQQNIPFLIVIPEKAAEVTQKAAKMLKEVLTKFRPGGSKATSVVRVVSSPDENMIQQTRFIFSLGNTSLSQLYRSSLPYDSIHSREQGYFIHAFPKTPRMIFVSGNQPIGTYYGTTTLIQLLDAGEGTYHHANIIDAPDWKNRAIYCNTGVQGPAGLDFLTRQRFNTIHLRLHEKSKAGIRQNIRELEAQSLDGKLFTPGLSLTARWLPEKIGSKEMPQPISGQYRNRILDYASSHHFGSYIIRMDRDLPGNESCGEIADSLGNHELPGCSRMVDLYVQELGEIRSRIGSMAQLNCLPVYYHTEGIRRSHGKGEIFLQELFKDSYPGIRYLWSGPVEYPLIVDESELATIRRYTGQVPGFFCKDINPYTRKKFISAYPGKARMSSLFDHMVLHLPHDMAIKEKQGFYADMDPHDVLSRIGLLSLSEYLWNSKDYDPDKTLLKILVSRYGKNTAFELLRLNEAYFGLYEMYGKIKSRETKVKYIRSAKDFKDQVDESMRNLQDQLENTDLFRELGEYRQQAEEQMQIIMSR